MPNVILTQQLIEQGHTPNSVAACVHSGELLRVRRGAYRAAEALDERATHRHLIEATLGQTPDDAVVSYGSAAVLHGLPLWHGQLTRVHLTRDRRDHGKIRRYVWLHAQPLSDAEITTVDGIRTTTLARTVADLSCELALDRAVAVGDAALRHDLDPADLAAVIGRAGRRVGVVRARRAAAMLDRRSESVGESRSRVLFALHHLPTPVLQWEVVGRDGALLARTDFAWPELRTVGEFDGKVKYGRALLKPGQDPHDARFAEKQREDALRDLGLQVVRWVNPDLARPDELLVRLHRAFDRGRASRGR